MRNYDFHELLSPLEFEHFASSVLQIRDKQKVKTNQATKDGGIDLYFLDENVIGQVKRYKNNDSKVLSSLKKEVERVKNLNPNRYIIVTSAILSKEKREILLSIFDGYLHKNDIIDKDDLNELLVKPEYHRLEIEYLNLLVPNSFVLSHYLGTIENNKIYTKTEIELDKMKEEEKLFSVNDLFFKALDKLEKEKTIIITGEPGVGKSILGRMLSAYLINSNSDIEFISIDSLDELYQMFKKDKSQIYFFDDFWGDTKYNFQITENEKEEFINFTKYIQKLNNKFIIMTTREYILKDGIQSSIKLKDKYQFYQFSINMKAISEVSKFNILFNHISCTNLSWNHLNILLRYWKTIVNNNNYNPRYIQAFLNNYYNYKDLEDFEFLQEFINYLDNPYIFWKDIVNKQPLEVILLLIIIALNNNNLDIKNLNQKYNNIISIKKLENNTLNDFKNLIKRMDNEFTITRLIDENLIIEFKNPSYKDFIYDYFKENMAFYISYIYNENLSINELINLWNVANQDFELFKDLKEIKEVDSVLSNQMMNQDINTKYYSLIELARVTDFNYSTNIKNYLISFMETNLEEIEDIYFFDNDCFQLIFALLEELANKYNFSDYIYSLLDIIVFGDQQLFYVEKLIKIKKLYPNIYNDFYKKYRYNVRSFIFYSIKSDIYYLEKEKDLQSLEFIIYEDIPQLYRDLELKVPKKLMEELECIIDNLSKQELKDTEEEFDFPKSNKEQKKTKKEENMSFVDKKIKELIGENEYINDIDKLLRKWKISPKVKKEIYKIEEDFLRSLINYKETLSLLCQYFLENQYPNDPINFLEEFEEYLIKKNNFTEKERLELYNLSYLLSAKKNLILKLEEINSLQILYPKCINKVVNSTFFIKRGKWYHFVHPVIQIHILLRFINNNIDIKNRINLKSLVYHLYECYSIWWDLDFVDYDNINIYKLIEKVFPTKWNQEVRIPIFKEYLQNINTKDDIEIAKSMLKSFNLTFEYEYVYGYSGGTTTTYQNGLLYELLKTDFDIDIFDFFIIDSTPCDKMNQFLCELAEKNEELKLNEYLRKKWFINLLKECGIINKLKELYQAILIKISEKIINH